MLDTLVTVVPLPLVPYCNNIFWEACVWMITSILLQLTGRVEPKRRWSDGIHQAVEAKEGLKIQVIIYLQLAILQCWNYKSDYFH
jgi:hypothetical protein